SAIVAEELGGMCARVVDLTLEYVKTRKQFGVAIGSFQAVQHKLSDMHLQSEALRSLAAFATWAAQESKEQSELSSRAALAFACEHAPQIIETAIQMHGGIGFTWEYELHLYLRRAKMLELLFGSGEAEHQSLIASVK
ncbi:MAG: acyl-CoA dehydrogenase, partial [Deltaproteobacteria bacterium]|nr:acyl-CoA dehydrogenase [Deltaproteobacteria bacterium]